MEQGTLALSIAAPRTKKRAPTHRAGRSPDVDGPCAFTPSARNAGNYARSMHDQYSREVVIPGMGTGYLPSGPGCNGAGESSVS